jgi:hypothetical protein
MEHLPRLPGRGCGWLKPVLLCIVCRNSLISALVTVVVEGGKIKMTTRKIKARINRKMPNSNGKFMSSPEGVFTLRNIIAQRAIIYRV